MRDGWRRVTLGEVSTAVRKCEPEQDFHYIDIASISRERKAISESTWTKASEAPGRARQQLQEGDVLVSTVRPNLNTVAAVGADHDGAVGSTGFSVLRAREDALPGYLFAVVGSRAFVEAMAELATGSSYPAVTDKTVRGYQIALPPLSEQRRVVDLIAAVDDVIEATEGEAEAASSAIDAFLTTRFASSLVGPHTFGDYLTLTGLSTAVEAGRSYRTIGVLNRGRGLFDRGDMAASETSYTKLNVVGEGQLIYSRLKAFEGAITVTLSDLGEAFASAEFPCFSLGSNVSADWLREITRCPQLWELLASRSKGMGGRRERLKPADFLPISLTPPALHEQISLARSASIMRGASEAARGTADALRTLRSNMLTVLLSGEHEIPATYDELLEVT